MRFRDFTDLPDEKIDLDRAALLIATLETPDLEVEPWLAHLDALGTAVSERAAGAAGDLEGLAALTDVLYGELGLAGNTEDYYHPDNSFLHRVLERRLGIPISLAVLLIEVGRRAGVPLLGVGLPGHFLVRHARHTELLLDPFDSGRILARGEIEDLLRGVYGDQANLLPQMLKPVGPRQILARMHHNLRAIYLERGDLKKAARVIDRLVRLEPQDPRHRRDRGVLRIHAADPRGLDDLESYLADAGEVSDREEIETLLEKARARLAAVH